jgi:hypothetical protein
VLTHDAIASSQVNGQSLEGMHIESARQLIMGPPGSEVQLALMRNGQLVGAQLFRGNASGAAPLREMSPPPGGMLFTHRLFCRPFFALPPSLPPCIKLQVVQKLWSIFRLLRRITIPASITITLHSLREITLGLPFTGILLFARVLVFSHPCLAISQESL